MDDLPYRMMYWRKAEEEPGDSKWMQAVKVFVGACLVWILYLLTVLFMLL